MFARTWKPLQSFGAQTILRRPMPLASSPGAVFRRTLMTTTKKQPSMILQHIRTTGLFASAASVTFGAGLWKPKVYCQAAAPPPPSMDTAESVVEAVQTKRKGSLVRKGELSFGMVLGLCTGYLIKKVGKLFALMVGVGFVFLQYLSFNGFITVNWDRMEGKYNEKMGVDQHGRVTYKNAKKKWNALVGLLTHNIQFKSTFLVGLYAGVRYG